MHKVLYLKQVNNKVLLYSTWNSAQCYVAAWMRGKFGGEWIFVYVWLHPFTAQMKLSQYCWFAIAQYNIKSSKKEKKNCLWRSCWREGHGERPQGDHTPPAGTFIFLQGTYVRLRRGGWSSSISPPDSVGKWGFLCLDFTVLWVRPRITHQNASHQSCRT